MKSRPVSSLLITVRAGDERGRGIPVPGTATGAERFERMERKGDVALGRGRPGGRNTARTDFFVVRV